MGRLQPACMEARGSHLWAEQMGGWRERAVEIHSRLPGFASLERAELTLNLQSLPGRFLLAADTVVSA